MFHKIKKFILLIILLCSSTLGFAIDKVEIDGFTYYLNNYNGKLTADVASPEEGEYSGDIIIPESVTYKSKTYPVTGIFAYAFCFDPITSITIPNSVTEININAFKSCHKLKEIRIPNSVTKIGVAVFEGCSNLKNVIFEDGSNTLTFGTQSNCLASKSFANTSVDSLYLGRPIRCEDGSNPFEGMSKSLRALDMRPNWGKRTGTWFKGFSSLKNVYLSNNLQGIDNYAFQNCSQLSSILISNGISSIGTKAFYNCSSLQDVRIPTSVTLIADNAFSGCSSMKSLIVLGKPYFGIYHSSEGTLFAYKDLLDEYDKNISGCEKVEITNPYYAILYKNQKLSSISFQIKDISHPQSKCELTKVEFEGNEIAPKEESVYSLTNLKPAQEYNITLVLNDNGTEKRIDCPIQTVFPQILRSTAAYITNATITIETPKLEDELQPQAMGVEFGEKNKIYETSSLYATSYRHGGQVSINNLEPNHSYKFIPYIDYGNGRRAYGEQSTFETSRIKLDVTNKEQTPTTLYCEGKYNIGSLKFKEAKFESANNDNVFVSGNTIKMTGLHPNKEYTITYTVITEEGFQETKKFYLKTKELSLKTLQPKCVSSTSAVVAAETNISNEETGVGFQWKKYDAPESLNPNEGNAIVSDGQIEGRISNLQSAFYYKVRAYYKTSDEKYYYGDWVTFDPSDFSYFEPTVHTYNNVEVKNNSAILRGVVLQGSDEITEQGFEYWSGNFLTRQANTDKQIITADGQRMEAELTNLTPNTTYYYRAFAKTFKNTTYGETMQFETSATTSMPQIEDERGNTLKVGVRTNNGLQLSVLGINNKCSYKIFSMTGNTIVAGYIMADGEWHNVSNTNLQSGVYIIQVYDGKKITSTKVAVK